MLVELKLPPGTYKNGTDYQAQGRYIDSNLVRWYEGTLRPIGGWRAVNAGAPRAQIRVDGAPRGALTWKENATNDPLLTIGTHTKLYARRGTVNALMDITTAGLVPGFASTNANTGYGGGAYGVDSYGTPRTPTTFANIATTWSFDLFGEFLVAVHSEDGRLFYWDLVASTAVPVVATSGTVPIKNKGVIVTDERFVMLLQAGGLRRRIAWSDQENLFNWQITATTQAGDFELATVGEIMCAKKARGQTLILTSVDAFVASYLGPPLVYGFEKIADGCGCISRAAAINADKLVFWMGNGSFFAYDGFVKELPCEVSDYVFGRLNRAQVAKVWATYNSDFNEVTWFYPAGMEIDSYVSYNISETHWSVGSMSRTTGVDNQVLPNAIRTSADGLLWEHEVGFSYDGDMPFCQTGPLEIAPGENVMMAVYLYPDERNQGDVQARFSTKFYPNAPEYKHGPYSLTNPTSVRFTGRQASMIMEVKDTSDPLSDDPINDLVDSDLQALIVQPISANDFRIGTQRVDVRPGGLR